MYLLSLPRFFSRANVAFSWLQVRCADCCFRDGFFHWIFCWPFIVSIVVQLKMSVIYSSHRMLMMTDELSTHVMLELNTHLLFVKCEIQSKATLKFNQWLNTRTTRGFSWLFLDGWENSKGSSKCSRNFTAEVVISLWVIIHPLEFRWNVTISRGIQWKHFEISINNEPIFAWHSGNMLRIDTDSLGFSRWSIPFTYSTHLE